MTSFGELGLLLAMLVTVAPAPAVDDAWWMSRVTGALAARWSVPAADVVLDAARAAGAAALAPDTPIRLDGRDRDGWLVLLASPAEGPARMWPVRAGVRTRVPVAARDLATGSRLENADIRDQTIVRWGMPARVDEPAAAPGWEVRRAIAAGEPLTRPAVAPPPLVTAGGPVTLEWVHEGVRITIGGVALHAARAHENVRVRLDGGRETRIARVSGPGTAVLMEDPR